MRPSLHAVNTAVTQAIYGVWRYDTPLYMGAMAEMMRRRGAPPGDVPKDLPQQQLVRDPDHDHDADPDTCRQHAVQSSTHAYHHLSHAPGPTPDPSQASGRVSQSHADRDLPRPKTQLST
jgi:hypothetical protein